MNQQVPEEYPGERRKYTRFRIQAPSIARVGNREFWAFTKEMSTQAVRLCTAADEEVPLVGENVDFLIKIPPSMRCTTPCFISGRGRTIRVDDLPGGETGVVVEILDYEIETQLVHADQGS